MYNIISICCWNPAKPNHSHLPADHTKLPPPPPQTTILAYQSLDCLNGEKSYAWQIKSRFKEEKG